MDKRKRRENTTAFRSRVCRKNIRIGRETCCGRMPLCVQW